MLSAVLAPVPIATDLSYLPTQRRVEMADSVRIRPELNLADRLPQHAGLKPSVPTDAEAGEPETPPAFPAAPPEEPPLPPGAMFAAAIIAGQLSPKPESMEEVFLRVGVSWTPPDSQYRLTDKLI